MLNAPWDFLIDIGQRFAASAPVQLWFWGFVVALAIETAINRPAPGEALRSYRLNALYGAIYLGAAFFLAPSVFTLVAILRDAVGLSGLIDLRILKEPGYLNQAAVFLLYLFVTDFFQYWWHRAQHRFPVLWDQHLVHHSDEHVTAASATRHHWTEFVFQAFTVALPYTMLFNVTPEASGMVAVIFGAWPVFTHMNVRLHLGPLAPLLAAPQSHRIHHSALREHRDRNFASYFPIWDVIFGTYHHPRPGEFPRTGVDGVRFETVWELTTAPFARWSRRIRDRMVPAAPARNPPPRRKPVRRPESAAPRGRGA